MPHIQLPLLKPVRIPTRSKTWTQALKVWWTTQREWELVEDYRHTLDNGRTIVIPSGFVFNGTTVPRPMRWLIDPTGIFLIPSILHDFAYTYNYQWVEGANGCAVYPPTGALRDHRALWDVQFYAVSVQVNGMRWLCLALYGVLKVFGGSAWRKGRRAFVRKVYPKHCQ